MVFGGDWAQTLPVVPRGSIADIVAFTLQRSFLWQDVTALQLRTDMRLKRPGLTPEKTERIERFAQWLRRVGTGQENDVQNLIKLPAYLSDVVAAPSAANTRPQNAAQPDLQVDEPYLPLIDHCYGDLTVHPVNPADPDWTQYFSKRAILAAKIFDVDQINANVLARMPGQAITFRSAGSVLSQQEQRERSADIPVERSNTLRSAGLPGHLLKLKIGAPIILLRNMNPSDGLYNGIRLIITNMSSPVLEAVIISGDSRGKKVFISRLALDHEDIVGLFILLTAVFAHTIFKIYRQWSGDYSSQ